MKRFTRPLTFVAIVVSTLTVSTAGWAFWANTGTGTGTAAAKTLSSPGVSVPGNSTATVHVSWTGVSAPGGGAVDGYYVRRFAGSTSSAACGSSAASLLTAQTSCDDTASSGTYTYKVTAVYKAWSATSAASTAVTVDTTPPTQSLALTNLTGGAYLSGTTIYYKANAAGSFTLTDTVADSGSGPASAAFPAIATTGWTHNNETLTSPAGGPYASATFSWTANPTNPTGYVVTGKDIAGNAVTTALTFVSDTGAPTNSLALTPVSGGALLSGTTVFYKGNTAGSFTLTDTVSDNGSGPASATFPAIATTGWAHATETPTSPTGGPYGSSAFSWSASPTNPTGYIVTGRDNVGNSVTTSLTFTNDCTAPATGSVSYTNGSVTTQSVPITLANGTDGGSGINTAGTQLQRASVAMTNGACGPTYSSFSTIATAPALSYSDTSVASGNCYKYQYLVTDQVGNSATYTSASVAKVPLVGIDIQGVPAGGGDGKPNTGDKLVFTFSEQVTPGSIKTGWDGTGSTSVTVNFDTGGDKATIGGGVNLGTIDLGASGYVQPHGSQYTLNGNLTMATDNGHSVLTITLTSNSPWNSVAGTPTMTWTPSVSAKDPSGNTASGSVSESGASDADF